VQPNRSSPIHGAPRTRRHTLRPPGQSADVEFCLLVGKTEIHVRRSMTIICRRNRGFNMDRCQKTGHCATRQQALLLEHGSATCFPV
jgi:hypothetical protein